ncbi:MAG TPA: PqqD family protein [Polyangiaceae bacterium]
MQQASYDLSRLRSLAISDTGFVFDPRTGQSFTVNSSGLLVMKSLKDGLPIRTIQQMLRDTLDGGHSVEDDVESFLQVLLDLGLTSAESVR